MQAEFYIIIHYNAKIVKSNSKEPLIKRLPDFPPECRPSLPGRRLIAFAFRVVPVPPNTRNKNASTDGKGVFFVRTYIRMSESS